MKEASENTPLAPRDIYYKNVNASNIEGTPFLKIASAVRKRRARLSQLFPRRCQNLTKFWEKTTIWEKSREKIAGLSLQLFMSML